MKHAWIALVGCAAALLLCAVPCRADAPAHSLGHVEPNPELKGIPEASDLQGAILSDTMAYIGVWADDAHSDCDVFPAQYTQFDVWIWSRPSSRGIQGAQFAVSFPQTVVTLSTAQNPDITVSLGSLPAGISVAYGECQTDWTYTHRLTCLSLATSPGLIQIVPHPDILAHPEYLYCFGTCELRYPLEGAYRLSHLHVNQSCAPFPDGFPPSISSLRLLSQTELEAEYSEPVTEESAENLANYYVCELGCAGSIPIAGITLHPDQKTIGIALGSPIAVEVKYFLGYFNIEDTTGMVRDYRALVDFGYMPDLVISSPWVEPDSFYVNTSEIAVGYKIKNSGTWPSGPFDATIRWYPFYGWSETVATVSYDGLAVGDSLVDSIRIAPPTIEFDINTFRYWVDYLDNVNEIDENNNTATRGIYVYLPNLVIDRGNAVAEPDTISDGCTAVRSRYRIRNIGPVDAGPFPTSIYLYTLTFGGRRLLTTINYPGLAAGASITDSVTTVLPPDIDDDNSLLVTANDPRAFVESGYNDNGDWAELPNYAPGIVSIEDRPDDAGGFVTLTFYRSRFDVDKPYPITHYDIVSHPSGTVLAEVPATHHTDYYSVTVPTVGDSSGANIPWSLYRVRAVSPIAATTDTQFYFSCPDSGYSVNNQIATFFRSFAVSLKDLRIETTWNLAAGSDAPEFIVMRENRRAGEFVTLNAVEILVQRLEYTFVDSDVEPGESYRYRIEYLDGGSQHLLFETEFIDLPALPLTLYQNHPNPFNPRTVIRYYLPDAGPVRLEVFDVRGSRVAVLVDGREGKGMHGVEWNGADVRGNAVGTGIYFCRLVADKKAISRKMMLLR